MGETSTTEQPATITASGAPRWQPDRSTLAARSLVAVNSLPLGSPERSAAFGRFMDDFPSPLLMPR